MTTLMSHRDDPDTSTEAARLASLGTKKGTIQSAILMLLESGGPATASELHMEYFICRPQRDWPAASVLDIRRRASELKKHMHRIYDTGKRRKGEAVLDCGHEHRYRVGAEKGDSRPCWAACDPNGNARHIAEILRAEGDPRA
jgi:hypothetical protein